MNYEAFVKGAAAAVADNWAQFYDHPGQVEYPWPGSVEGSKYSLEAEKAFYAGLRAKGYGNMWDTGDGDMVLQAKNKKYHTWDHELGKIVPMLRHPTDNPRTNRYFTKAQEPL